MTLRPLLCLTTALALGLACSGDTKPKHKKREPASEVDPEVRAARKALKAKLSEGVEVERGDRTPTVTLGRHDIDAPPVVVFAVLDTLRADHTSLCGYERPTTPVLEAIVSRRGATHTCRAYSPAPWTHPSHATFFTGRSVVEHAAIWVSDSDVAINPVTRVRPLDTRYVTLAELFRQNGYQTVAVSANMIVTKPSGLLQGFDHVTVGKDALELRGERFQRELKQTFKQHVKPNKPLFLFVNFYDAHDPYPAIPADAGWVPEQPLENLHPNQHDETHEYYRYVKGLSTDEEAAPFLKRVVDGYDYGVSLADRNLGSTMKWLEGEGWLSRGYRLVITSDHGEFLGEHRKLRHGGFVHEPVVNVPLLYLDTSAETQPTLPEPLSGQAPFFLTATGAIPADLPPAHAVSESNERDVLVGELGGAVWVGANKAVCADGTRWGIDLKADPGELARLPIDQSPLAEPLDVLCDRVDEMAALPPPEFDDPELIEALKAVGYME